MGIHHARRTKEIKEMILHKGPNYNIDYVLKLVYVGDKNKITFLLEDNSLTKEIYQSKRLVFRDSTFYTNGKPIIIPNDLFVSAYGCKFISI